MDCEDEWAHAYEICEEWFASPERQRGLHERALMIVLVGKFLRHAGVMRYEGENNAQLS